MDNLIIDFAKQENIPLIKAICHDNKETLGFITLGRLIESVNKQEIILINDIGFLNFHTRKDNVSVCYLLCVIEKKRNKGYGIELLKYWYLIAKQQKAIKLRLKCINNSEANMFYLNRGFTLINKEDNKNIYEMDI
jgi:GNAT superfamily N-acetyltransferase